MGYQLGSDYYIYSDLYFLVIGGYQTFVLTINAMKNEILDLLIIESM